MLVKRSIFEAVGWFFRRIRKSLCWDLDFCLRVGKNGKRVDLRAICRVLSLWGQDRNIRGKPKKRLEEFHQAIALFEKRWSELIRKGDPFL